MIVLDASAAVDLLLDTTPYSARIGAHLLEHVGEVHAPHLLDAEVGHVLRRHVLRGELRPRRAEQALELLADLRIVRYGHVTLLSRALQLRRSLTVYDALYVSLAEVLEAPLLTRDAGMARSARRLVKVIHVG